MYRYRKFVNLVVFLFIILIAYNPEHNPIVINDVDAISEVTRTEDVLYKEIQDKSPEYSQDPQNAYIDSVWKKTPGRNGAKVNLEESYENMKEEGTFKESLLVYDQTPPEVKLKDLQASPIFRGHPEKDMVSLLFNVSWGEEHIPDILNILNEHNVKATFFIEGKWAQQNSESVKMIDEQGHVVGNHAYNHPDMTRLTEQENTRQIAQTNEIIKAITGKDLKWFAPPSGNHTEQVVQVADALNMETILWTVDTIDWKNPSVSVMINRVINKLHPGATILMHPTPSIVEGLEPLIKNIKENGYRIGTIEKLLNEER